MLENLLQSLVEKHDGPIFSPNWSDFHRETRHVHDWRTYVPTPLQHDDYWSQLDVKTRAVLIETCECLAEKEDWD